MGLGKVIHGMAMKMSLIFDGFVEERERRERDEYFYFLMLKKVFLLFIIIF